VLRLHFIETIFWIVSPIIILAGLVYIIIKFHNEWISFQNKGTILKNDFPNNDQATALDKFIVEIHGPGEYGIDVVGESSYQKALSFICGGKTQQGHDKIVEAILYHEDDIPYDNQAIRVDINEKTVGYLSRKLAREFRKKMNEAGHPGKIASCSALIVGGWIRDDSEGHFGVRLDLPKEKRKRKKEL
jgi:hypothetical protein